MFLNALSTAFESRKAPVHRKEDGSRHRRCPTEKALTETLFFAHRHRIFVRTRGCRDADLNTDERNARRPQRRRAFNVVRRHSRNGAVLPVSFRNALLGSGFDDDRPSARFFQRKLRPSVAGRATKAFSVAQTIESTGSNAVYSDGGGCRSEKDRSC